MEEVKIVIGPASLALDDAKSKAQCPSGFQLLGCRCSVSNCDGAIPYDTYCVASASYHRTPVQVGKQQRNFDVSYILMHIFLFVRLSLRVESSLLVLWTSLEADYRRLVTMEVDTWSTRVQQITSWPPAIHIHLGTDSPRGD